MIIMVIECPYCNIINEVGSNFCMECGNQLEKKSEKYKKDIDSIEEFFEIADNRNFELNKYQLFQKSKNLDPVSKIFRKSPILGYFVFSIPSLYAIFLMIFYTHPFIPGFDFLNIFGMILLYVFIHVASTAQLVTNREYIGQSWT